MEQIRLSIKEKIGYSLGDAASNLYFQTFVIFMPIFYTDVFGLAAGTMGTMMMFSRFWDAANDPIMGMIADRTQTKWGKFRPYIAAFAIPIGIAGYFAFSTPDLPASQKLLYAYISYILLMMLYTAVNVPYAALMGVITTNSEERTEVSSYRFVAAFIGQVVVGAATLGLVQRLGQGNDALGWKWTMGIYGIIAAVLLFGTFKLTKERVTITREQNNKISDDLLDLIRNRPWVLIGLATFFQLTFFVMRGSSIAYYLRYFVGDQQLQLLGMTIDLGYVLFTSSFITVGTVSTLIGAVTTKLFTNRMSKKSVYSSFLIISSSCSLGFYLLSPDQVFLMYLLNAIFSFFIGAVSVTQWAIYTDTADFGEWKFNRRATGLIMAASLFLLKLGLTVGGSSVGWLLDVHGFVANTDQASYALEGIKRLMSVYPAVFGFIGGALMVFYPLTDNKMKEIEIDLKAREEVA